MCENNYMNIALKIGRKVLFVLKNKYFFLVKELDLL